MSDDGSNGEGVVCGAHDRQNGRPQAHALAPVDGHRQRLNQAQALALTLAPAPALLLLCRVLGLRRLRGRRGPVAQRLGQEGARAGRRDRC